MVAVWGAGGQGPSTTLAMVDHEGTLIDMLYSGELSGAIRHPREFNESYDWQDAIQDPHKVCLQLLACCSGHSLHACMLLLIVCAKLLVFQALRLCASGMQDSIVRSMLYYQLHRRCADTDTCLTAQSLQFRQPKTYFVTTGQGSAAYLRFCGRACSPCNPGTRQRSALPDTVLLPPLLDRVHSQGEGTGAVR